MAGVRMKGFKLKTLPSGKVVVEADHAARLKNMDLCKRITIQKGKSKRVRYVRRPG